HLREMAGAQEVRDVGDRRAREPRQRVGVDLEEVAARGGERASSVAEAPVRRLLVGREREQLRELEHGPTILSGHTLSGGATMAPTPQEVFAPHAEVLIAGDLEGIVSDYAGDAVFITPAGALHGKDGVREGFTQLLSDLPSAEWAVPTQIFEGDHLFIEWSAV